MEGSRHQHLHQEWQEPLEEPHNHHHHHRCRRRRRRRHHHHHHLFFQLLLKVFIVARVIFKRLNPGAAEDVLVVRRHLPAAEPTPRLPLGHVKDAAQDVAEDVTQDMAEDVLGAAEDGSSSVSDGKIITTRAACPKLPSTPTPPKAFSSTVSSSSRQALFERLKPFVCAAGPVTVAVDS